MDLSPRAIRFARFNLALNGMSDRAKVRCIRVISYKLCSTYLPCSGAGGPAFDNNLPASSDLALISKRK